MEEKASLKERVKRMLFPAFLFIMGMCFMFSSQISGFLYELKLEQQDEIIDSLSSEQIANNLAMLSASEEDAFNFEEIQNIDGFVLPKTDINNVKNAIGIITIPSVDLEQPILHGTTNENLLVGATTMKASQKMGEGNYTLAGHNHHTKPVLFQPIRNMKVGDKIFVTDKKKIYTYVMTKREIVEPHRVDVLDDIPGKTIITLVSCYAKDGSNRIIITGELIEVNEYMEQDKNNTSEEKQKG